MAIQNFSICALNIDENCIETLDTFTQNNVFHIKVSLKPDYPDCPGVWQFLKIVNFKTAHKHALF